MIRLKKYTSRPVSVRKILMLVIVLISMHSEFVKGQEVLRGLAVNPVVMEHINRMQERWQESVDTVPILLPFHDDFSSLSVFPSHNRWIDRFAFVNDDYPVFPVNIGVVTLDAVNDSGRMYTNATPGPATFIADNLTSRYIRLDSVFSPVPKKMTPADSVWLSFYYQPQGRGRAPQHNDSLILQFLVKPAYDSLIPGGGVINIPDKWQRIWYSNGMPLDTFYVKHNQWFKQVMIPITQEVFFSKKFRFRFYNHVSLASSSEPSWQSNTDQWNIDQVYLNSGRSRFDTVYPELRFIQRPSNLLKRYSSMPYPHYSDNPTNELRDSLDVLMSNKDIVPHMSSYNYTVTQDGAAFTKTYNGGNYNIQPYAVSPYVTYQKFAHPEMPFLLPVNNTDSALFRTTHIVRDITPGSPFGDTVVIPLKFYNYFSYDDGTPEASYGLTPSGAKLAYGFKLNKSPDTLRAIRFYFNQTLSSAEERQFLLCVWNDNSGKPGDTIYSRLTTPKFADSLNKFVTYHLSPPIAVTGNFYVGWIQLTGDNLSVGFDRYNNSQQYIFYNVGGSWINSAFSGSLLIRPVLGKPIPLGVEEEEAGKSQVRLFPNPCNTGTLQWKSPDLENVREDLHIRIFDLTGRLRLTGPAENQVDVSGLAAGIYLFSLVDGSGLHVANSRLIITR